MMEHPGRHVEVRDRPLSQWSNRHDMLGGPTHQLCCVTSKSENFARSRVHGDNGRLLKDEAFATDGHPQGGRPDVDGDLLRHRGQLYDSRGGRSRR